MPSLCNVASSIYQLFVPHFAMAVFMCIYIFTFNIVRINKTAGQVVRILLNSLDC